MTVPKQFENRKLVSERRLATKLMLVMLPIAVLCSGAASADWNFDPILRAAWDVDDNATLSTRTDDEVDLSGYMAEASLDLIYNSESSYLSMRPMVRTRNYGNKVQEENWNANDQFFEMLGLFDGDKNSFRLLGNFSQESVRTAELADADLDTEIDPDDIADDQSGFISTTQRRSRYRISPSWTRRFSDVSSIETDLGYLTTGYDETGDLLTLFDFTDIRLRVNYRRNFSERNSSVFSISARDFDTDRFGGDRKSYELSGGFVRRLSETTQFRARVGLESVNQEDVGLPTTSIDPQPTAEFTMSRQLETIRLMAQYRKRVNATGRGNLTTRDELNLRFSRDLNDRVTIGLGARAYKSETVSGFALTQNFVQIRGQVVWRISRIFSMQADYRHTANDRGTIDGAADSNRVTIWLSYQPRPASRDPRLRVQF
ncbi:MAG: hypothetical protein QNK34_07530 [Woeseiaceae bacterium]|nr:hypothetical protein [Woeseiaceae bacterium]